MNTLPERLKAIREQRGLTQRQLAKTLNISPSTIALYETGDRNPDPNMLKRLADFLDCSVDWLLGRINDDSQAELNETLAAHRNDDPTQELPEEARRILEEFKDYILKKYGKK